MTAKVTKNMTTDTPHSPKLLLRPKVAEGVVFRLTSNTDISRD